MNSHCNPPWNTAVGPWCWLTPGLMTGMTRQKPAKVNGIFSNHWSLWRWARPAQDQLLYNAWHSVTSCWYMGKANLTRSEWWHNFRARGCSCSARTAKHECMMGKHWLSESVCSMAHLFYTSSTLHLLFNCTDIRYWFS